MKPNILSCQHTFDAAWERYREQVFRFICVRVGDREEAEDLTQETYLRVWSVVSEGTRVEAFLPYLCQAARHVTINWVKHCRRRVVLEPLEEQPEEPAPGPSVEQAVDLQWSCEFLMQQLDEVLIHPSATPTERKWGTLRKRAFLLFYAGELTLPELLAELTPQAQALGLSPPTCTQLNNWLSRGDVLNSLARHLVEDHPDWIVATTRDCLAPLDLSPPDAEIARLRWQEGRTLESIAAACGLPLSDVSHTIARLTRHLTPLVSAQMKERLHEVRKGA